MTPRAKRARPGTKPRISPAQLNRFISTAEHFENSQRGYDAPPVPNHRPQIVVPCVNLTGANRDQFDVCHVRKPRYAPSGLETDMRNYLPLEAAQFPTALYGTVGVFQAACASNAVGRVAIAGVTPCRLALVDIPGHQFFPAAEPIYNDFTKLRAVHHGPHSVVWHDSSTEWVGGVGRGVVLLGGGTYRIGTFLVTGGANGANGTALAALTGDRFLGEDTGGGLLYEGSTYTIYVREISQAAEQYDLNACQPTLVGSTHIIAWYGTTRYGTVKTTGWHAFETVKKTP